MPQASRGNPVVIVIVVSVEDKGVEVVDIANEGSAILTIFKGVFNLEKTLNHIEIVSPG